MPKYENHKNKKKCQISLLKNTVFENFHIQIQRALILIYCFVKKVTYDETINQPFVFDNVTSRATVTGWFAFWREICMDTLNKECEEEGRISWPSKIVKIDESKISSFNCIFNKITFYQIGKRKYNKGRLVDGHWIFGMVKRHSKICPENKRDEKTLLALLQKHVKPGTTIFSIFNVE